MVVRFQFNGMRNILQKLFTSQVKNVIFQIVFNLTTLIPQSCSFISILPWNMSSRTFSYHSSLFQTFPFSRTNAWKRRGHNSRTYSFTSTLKLNLLLHSVKLQGIFFSFPDLPTTQNYFILPDSFSPLQSVSAHNVSHIPFRGLKCLSVELKIIREMCFVLIKLHTTAP